MYFFSYFGWHFEMTLIGDIYSRLHFSASHPCRGKKKKKTTSFSILARWQERMALQKEASVSKILSV
jgi:hypothetical protein